MIRAYRSSGSPDPVAPHTIYNAVSGGLSPSNIDVYMFPDPHRSSAASQVKSMLDVRPGGSWGAAAAAV